MHNSIPTLLLFFCLMAMSNCTTDQPSSEDTATEEVSTSIEDTTPTDQVPPATLSTPTEAENQTATKDEPATDTKAINHPINPGKHNFTLQWISWEKPGLVQVDFLSENKYKVKGEQKGAENGDFAAIDGVLTWEGNQVFQFDGEITSRVSFVNGGETCVKKGPVHFRATGTRKYWRLQEKENCEGGNVVDYFDIYF